MAEKILKGFDILKVLGSVASSILLVMIINAATVTQEIIGLPTRVGASEVRIDSLNKSVNGINCKIASLDSTMKRFIDDYRTEQELKRRLDSALIEQLKRIR
jgi:hypothetical protein